VLYLRDAYQALIAGERDVPLRRLARQPLVVPGSLPLTRLLRDFQNRRIHLALVVDEYGGIDGLVTLEDVIEELVGEIEDETDVTEVSMIRISRNEIVAEGDTELREINHIFNTALPLLQHRSLNGYLMAELGRVPEPRERAGAPGPGDRGAGRFGHAGPARPDHPARAHDGGRRRGPLARGDGRGGHRGRGGRGGRVGGAGPGSARP
jgi:CBS domain containing-hemolysin-like protein